MVKKVLRYSTKLAGCIVLLAGIILKVHAHNAQPCYFEIRHQANGSVHITWKNLITDKSGVTLTPVFSHNFLPVPQRETVSGNYLVQQWILPGNDAMDQTVSFVGLSQSPLAVFVQVIAADGHAHTAVLTAAHPSFTSPNGETIYPVWAYLNLGIEHIWTGTDHLLFVLGLLLLVQGKRRLLKTITAFTIAHSITLALATLGKVNLPPAPVEAVIALSIIFLAVELLRHYEGMHRVTYHYPWIVAFAFGLLHGFGFAGALAEVGLPPHHTALALVLFNTGVETGQILFILALLLAEWLFRKPIRRLPSWEYKVPPYIIGSVAAFWFIERVIAIFG